LDKLGSGFWVLGSEEPEDSEKRGWKLETTWVLEAWFLELGTNTKG